jgi:hypothetical protein
VAIYIQTDHIISRWLLLLLLLFSTSAGMTVVMITTAAAAAVSEEGAASEAGAEAHQVAGVTVITGTMARVMVAASGRPHRGRLACTCCRLHSAQKQSSSAGESHALYCYKKTREQS